MGWADHAIKQLDKGERVTVTPRGSSMKPKVKSGEKVILAPVKDLKSGDIVLVKFRGRVYLHLIKAVDGERYQIGNNRGHVNGWVSSTAIYGKAVEFPDREAKPKKKGK